MDKFNIVGVDLGGTKVLAARIRNFRIEASKKLNITASGTRGQVIDEVIASISAVFDTETLAIGVGIPSVIDVDQGIIYDVQNIPSWQEVHLKTILENYFKVPVAINNDANCFAIGEKHFGIGKDSKNFVGLIIGTGLAAGIIINNQLYSGPNCGAGEFGMMPYLDKNYEHYASGQFFQHNYSMSGEEIYEQAGNGVLFALNAFNAFGTHLGEAIKTILFALDPELIILGGSVRLAYKHFKKSMWASINKFPYRNISNQLKIKVSRKHNIGVLGAAALHLKNEIMES